MRLTFRSITQNWKLKLAALGLALLLWAVVSAEQVTTQWLPVRVEPALRDPEYMLTGGPEPAEVRVRFTGPGRELWEMALDRPVLVLPVRDVGEARVFALDPAMVRVPTGLSVSAQDVRPGTVRLGLERLATRTVPVRVQIGSRSRSRWVVDSVEVLPPVVRVTGPAARLSRLEQVVTRPFEIVPDDSTFTRLIGIDTTGLGDLTLSLPQVRVNGRVERRMERLVRAVPVAPPEGLRATPLRVDVFVQGGERVLGRIDPAALRVLVVADSVPAELPPAGVDVPVVVRGLPAGVSARTVPVRVHVSPLPPSPADSAPPPAGRVPADTPARRPRR